MFERFTERARQVVVLAQEEARANLHQTIGTEHILLGLIREEEGLAARVLKGLGYQEDFTREKILRLRPSELEEAPTSRIAFSLRTVKVLELALREALSLGHNYIGTEHILLGLVRENEGLGMRVLTEAGDDSEKIRNEVIRMLSGPGGRREKPEETDKEAVIAESKWYVYYAHDTSNGISKEGGFLSKPRMQELSSVHLIRFFCSVSLEDIVEVYVPIDGLRHLKLVKE